MSTVLSTQHMSLPIGSLDTYIQRANQIDLLSAEEELELSKRFYENNDLEAARRIVMAHLRYVIRVAKGYSGYGLPISDLIQEGNIGLMKAVKKFNPYMGVRLVSFAVHWIKSEIHEYILRNWRIVKIATTKAQRKLFFNLRKYKKRLGWFTQKEIDEVAKDLNVSAKEVLHMEQRLNGNDLAFDEPNDDESEDNYIPAPKAYLSNELDPASVFESNQQITLNKSKLSNAILQLDNRSKDIIQKRWLNNKKATLKELAINHNVSAERIRQIEKFAINQLKTAIAR